MKIHLIDASSLKVGAAVLVDRLNTKKQTIYVHGACFTYKDIEAITRHPSISSIVYQTFLTLKRRPLLEHKPIKIQAIAHRIISQKHPFHQTAFLTPTLMRILFNDGLIESNPLNNMVAAIKSAMASQPTTPHVAVFDTDFYKSMPEYTYTYSLPKIWQKYPYLRKHGIHGVNCRSILDKYAQLSKKPVSSLCLVICHLGSTNCISSSIKNGKAQDTTTGFRADSNCLMGAEQSGSIDIGVLDYLQRQEGYSWNDIYHTLENQSGLKGLSGISKDMRDVLKAATHNNASAQFAINTYCYNVAKSIMSCATDLTRLDALIFTGGIGENASLIRSHIIQHLSLLQIKLNTTKNQMSNISKNYSISSSDSAVAVWVMKSEEEVLIAKKAIELLS